MDKKKCRQRLNLPQDATLIGVSGAISRSRDIETVFSAFEILNKKIPDSYMVLAGPKDSDLYIPDNKNILYLGVQPHDIIPSVIASLDLSIICNKDSSFGRFCFPLKFVETIACHTPLIASSVGVTKSMLKDYVDLLFDPGNSSQLSEAMLFQLKNKIIPDISINSWENIAEQLNDQIDELFQPR
ncbi:MAG: glycosyltransferase [Dissulfuribacterales bacterium]